MRKLYLLIFLTFAICVVQAQSFSGTYTFAGTTASSGTTDPTPVPTATGVTFGSFSAVGVSANSSAASRFSFTGWPTGATNGSNTFTGALSTTQYYEVTITPQSGFSLDINTITFTLQRSGTGIRQYAIRSSVDGYSANLPASINPANPNLSVVSTDIFQVSDATTAAENGSTITLGSAFDNISSAVVFRFYGFNAEAAGGTFSIDNVVIAGNAVSGSANIVATPTSLSGFTYIQGSGPSASQSFSITAANLSPAADNITVTGSTNYEVSANNTTFTSSYTIPYSGGSLSATTVFVRLKAGLAAGTYNGETIGLSGGGATASVTANGTVTAGSPTVAATPGSLSGFSTSQGTASASQSFTVSGSNLTADVIVTAPTDYEVSLTAGSGYGTSVTLTQSGGTVAATPVFVRIRASAPAGSPSGNVTVASTGATTQNVAVSGTVSTAPTITVTGTLSAFSSTQGTASAAQSFTVDATNLSANVVVTAPTGYQVSTDGTNFFGSVTLTPTGGTITAATVFVRVAANAPVGTVAGNVTVASTGATTRNVAATATVSQGTKIPFTTGNLVIYRVGDGSAALSGAAAPVYLEEYTPSGVLVQSIPLPTAVNGSNKRLTAAGNGTTEGMLTRSSDGNFLIVSGYDADVATASVAGSSSSTVGRTIGVVSKGASINTTTSSTSFGTSSIRGVTSTNGSDLWAVGSGSGVQYMPLGSSTSTQVSSTVTNLRTTNIFGGQLYVSSGSGTFRLATVGTGTPTTTGETITNLPGFPTTGSPYQFFFADLDAGVAGVDVVYVADDGSGTGFQKYSLVGGNWVANGNIAAPGNNLRGLTATVSGSTVTLYGTNGSSLISLVDASGYNATITGTPTVLSSAITNAAFRGVAFTPQSPFPVPVKFTKIAATQKGNSIQVDWANATEENVVSYTIERSADGRNFSAAGNVKAKANNGGKVDYSFLDASPLSGDNFYRIKAVETGGKVVLSNIVRINTSKKGIDLVIYPNPVRGADVNVQLSNLPAGKYTVKIYSAYGQEVDSRLMNHAGGNVSQSFAVRNLKPGMYTLQISGAANLQKAFIAE